jgi:hypothetical protein
LLEKRVGEICELPDGKTALPSKLILTVKRNDKGPIERYKARLVAKGFRQVAGRDYDEVFAHTAQDASFCIILALAAEKGWSMKQLDVKTAFLNGDLSKELCLRLPNELGGVVSRLRKALYGLCHKIM